MAGTTAVPAERAVRLASPAVLTLQPVPGGTELLFAGEVVGPARAPLADAVVEVWGVRLEAEPHRGFEILAHGPRSGADLIRVRVSAPGHAALDAVLAVDDATTRLGDGTVLVPHTFALGASGDGVRAR